MQKLPQIVLWVGLVAGVMGGIAEVLNMAIIVPPRAWAGGSVTLLLFAIGLNTQKQQ